MGFINYTAIPLDRTPEMDLFGQILKGYNFAKEPGRIQRLEEKETLLNKGLVNKNRIEEAEAEHAPEYYMNRAKSGGLDNLHKALVNAYYGQDMESSIGLRDAQAARMDQQGALGQFGRSSKRSPIAIAREERDALEAELGPDHPDVIQANSYVEKLSGSGLTGINKTKFQAAAGANEARKILTNKPFPFTGPMASADWSNTLLNYKTTKDPKEKAILKDKLIMAGVWDKFVPELASDTIIAMQGRGTVHERKDQEKSLKQGWPTQGNMKKILSLYPQELQEDVDRAHSELIEATSAAKAGVNYGNIGRGNKNKSQDSEKFSKILKNSNLTNEKDAFQDQDQVWIEDDETGERALVTVEEAKRRGAM